MAAPPLRWGIVGTGGIAGTFARDLAQSGAGEVVAVGSRTPESAHRFGERYGIATRYDSYEGLVNDANVQVVYVATPHPMHLRDATLALEAGKPVLVEKAFTMTSDEARTLVDLAREKQLFLMEAMWTRFLPHVAALRQLLAEEALGEIVSVEADHGQWFDFDPDFRLFAPELGGGALLDLGVYPVSFASMVLGRPKKIMALIDRVSTGVDGQTSMLFGYENQAHALLTCTSRAKSATRATITGTKARIEVDGDFYAPSAFSLIQQSGHHERFEFKTQGRGLHYEASEVSRCMREGLSESPLMPLDETIANMETMEAVLAFVK